MREAGPERLVAEVTEYAAIDDYVKLDRASSRRSGRSASGSRSTTRAPASRASAHLLRLGPEVIKIDRSLSQASTATARRRRSPPAISFADRSGASIIAEGSSGAPS